MSNTLWPNATPDRPCPVCGHQNRCRIAPDGTAAVCWRNGGKIKQLTDRTTAGGNGTGYVGAIHRLSTKPAPGNTDRSFATAEATIEAAGRSIVGAKLAGVWTYPGDVQRVARFDLPSGKKECRPVHQTPDGWKAMPSRRRGCPCVPRRRGRPGRSGRSNCRLIPRRNAGP